MSTELVAKEIRHFLSSDRAEVLCVRGRWGVGKTFAWRRYLGEAGKAEKLTKQSYAYVSLFGLNSLDDLRYAIFESTVPPERALTGPTAETFGELVHKGLNLGRKTRTWLGPALSAVGLGEIGNALSRSAFLLVRNQLICLDDMERAGDGLKPRDVLGMVSFLKEQRNCRVALLLNDEAMDDPAQADFRRLLEKVVDVTLTFAPTATEAAAIAVTDDEPIGVQLRRSVEVLGITNIRVIKKIERMALRLAELLGSCRPEILNQAVTACVLGGWAVFEPDHAPTLEFIRGYNSLLVAMRERQDGETPEVVRWRDRFGELPFAHADDFDRVVLDGMAVGFFDEDRLSDAAKELEESIKQNGLNNSFSRAWAAYHGSLKTDDDAAVDAIHRGALENLATIDPINISGAMRLLRDCGRNEQAEELAAAYVAAQPERKPLFFDLSAHSFSTDNPPDPALAAAFEAQRALFVDNRDPKDVLLAFARSRSWSKEDTKLLSSVSADAYEKLIEDTEGPDLKLLVRAALQLAAHGGQDTLAMQASLTEALTQIASKSPLRARRLRNWGFVPPAPDVGANASMTAPRHEEGR